METAAPARTWPDLITALLSGRDLTPAETRWAMGEVMTGVAGDVPLSAFLVALRAKGESVAEIHALAEVMLEHANRIEVPGRTIDIVGTGGDRAHTVNISTMAAIVVAGSGLCVVKHGNRSASSQSGSADVLEALGVDLRIDPARVAEVAEETGITFCFAQAFHPSMRYAGKVRRDLGIGTAFNVLGPVTNPAQPTLAAVGVADARMAPILAGVFAERGKDAAVFRGDDGLDELTVATTSHVWWVRDGLLRQERLDPVEVGLEVHSVDTLRGKDAEFNARVVRRILDGERSPVRDAVVLNAGVALALDATDRGTSHDDFVADVRAGMDRAEASLDSGAAKQALDRWVAATNR